MRVAVVGLMLAVEAGPRYQKFGRNSPAWGYCFMRTADLRRTCWLQAYTRGSAKEMGQWPIFCLFRRGTNPGRMECLNGATQS